ncbi:hypothetical protein [Dysosmobacter sp.]
MQDVNLDTSDWKSFWLRWDASLKKIPGLKEAMLERMGVRVRSEVRACVDRSGVRDHRGRVKLWQNRHIGSGKGYVAIRADSVEVTAGGSGKQTLNAGALTNFLSSGHEVRGPSGKAKRYVSRAQVLKVRGYDFYKAAAVQADKIAIQEAERFMNGIGGALQ